MWQLKILFICISLFMSRTEHILICLRTMCFYLLQSVYISDWFSIGPLIFFSPLVLKFLTGIWSGLSYDFEIFSKACYLRLLMNFSHAYLYVILFIFFLLNFVSQKTFFSVSDNRGIHPYYLLILIFIVSICFVFTFKSLIHLLFILV